MILIEPQWDRDLGRPFFEPLVPHCWSPGFTRIERPLLAVLPSATPTYETVPSMAVSFAKPGMPVTSERVPPGTGVFDAPSTLAVLQH